MNVGLVRVGYVGLVTAACFAEAGNSSGCADNAGGKIDRHNQGRVSICEPGLEAIVQRNVEAGRLVFTTELHNGMDAAQAVLLAVGTPSKPDSWPGIPAVHVVAESIGDLLTE